LLNILRTADVNKVVLLSYGRPSSAVAELLLWLCCCNVMISQRSQNSICSMCVVDGCQLTSVVHRAVDKVSC